MKKVIITGKAHPVLHETLLKNGFESVYAPAISRQELLEVIPGISGLVVATRLGVDRELLDKAVSLEWIARLGSGMDQIDTDYAEKRNIRCLSSPEGNRDAVAEHALGMLLSLMNHICRASLQVREGNWLRDENRGEELNGKTIGIIGYGNNGSAFARLLSSFGVRILAYDKYKTGFGNDKVEEASPEQVCREADVISFHVPLTGETRHMANREFFGSLARRPRIINTSRGGILDTKALLEALDKGYVSGVCLDVLENEDLLSYSSEETEIYSKLTARPDVLITPHIAGYTEESYYKIGRILIEKLGLSV